MKRCVNIFSNTNNLWKKPYVKKGTEVELGTGLGISNDFRINVIKNVGNYGEIYERHLGENTEFNLPRSQNSLWTDGGLLYSPPFR